MARKQTDKSDKKKLFFGEHLEIKPAFMQRPKSMEEVMAEAFSKTNDLKADSSATVETKTTVENPVNLINNQELETRVESKSTLVPSATVENLVETSDSKTTVAFDATLELTPTVENLSLDNKAIETTVDSNSALAFTATVENLSLDNKAIETTVDSIATLASKPTIEPIISLRDILSLSDEDKLSRLVPATVVNDATVAKNDANIAITATVVDNATVAKQSLGLEEIPQRLRTDVAMLKRLVLVNWQALPEQENISSNYWYAYAQAWHWIEDNVVTHLDKDSKLTLRHCYRKAFGDPTAKGKFFAGQSLLAQEVGLSKRRIQDVLEIFNLLGWVCKTAHHNRGGYKGTDYQMYLPTTVIDYFKL
ncbi:MAG: hypothetical protein WAQ98_22015 [Blastocatellia bacterium]